MDSLAIPFPTGRTIAEFPGDHDGNDDKGSDPKAPSRKPLQLTVKSLMNGATRVEAFEDDTVLDLKLLLQDMLLVSVDLQQLVFRCQVLADGDTLGECGLTDGCELVLILRLRGGDSTPVVPDVMLSGCSFTRAAARVVDHEAGPMELSIRIRRGKCVVVKTSLGATVGSVKRSIEKVTEVPVAQQILTFRGEDMSDEKTLGHYELRDRCCVYLSLSRHEDTSSPPTAGPAEYLSELCSRLQELSDLWSRHRFQKSSG